MKQTLEARWFFEPESAWAAIINKYVDTILWKPFSNHFNRHDYYFVPLTQHLQSYIIRNNKVHIIKLHTHLHHQNAQYFRCEKYKIWDKPKDKELQEWHRVSIDKERILLPFLDKHLEISAIRINNTNIFYTIWLEASNENTLESFFQEWFRLLTTLWLEKYCDFTSIDSYPTFIKSHYL